MSNAKEFHTNKRLAMVGASSKDSNKFGNMAAKELVQRGYEVFFVHPTADSIDGSTAYNSLAEVKDKVDGVIVCVPSHQAAKVVEEAAAAGLKNVWLQQGSDSPPVLAKAQELGLNLVSRKCILMYAEPVTGFHNFHKVLWKLIGQY